MTESNETQENIEKKEEIQQNTENEAKPPIKSEHNEENWQKYREARERDRKALKEAQEREEKRRQEVEALKAALESVVSKPTPNDHQQTNYYEEDEDEQKRIERLVKEQIERDREARKKEEAEREQKEIPNRLAQTFPDYEQVCSDENCDYLLFHHPELAAGFRHMPDNFDKWATVYKAIKKYVPYQNKEGDKKRMERNLSKPQSNPHSSMDTSPQTVGWKLTEQRRSENWRRMQSDMKNVAS